MPIIQLDVSHAIAGGAAGCAGAIVTSPLEIVKTRLQSSVATFNKPLPSSVSKSSSLESAETSVVKSIARKPVPTSHLPTATSGSHYVALKQCYSSGSRQLAWSSAVLSASGTPRVGGECLQAQTNFTTRASAATCRHPTQRAVATGCRQLLTQAAPPPYCCSHSTLSQTITPHTPTPQPPQQPRLGLLYCFRYIIQREGFLALYKGLLPTLVGVVPSRSIFFCTYESFKSYVQSTDVYVPDTLTHMSCSAIAAFTACTATNPIWVMKTRLQLDQSCERKLTIRACFQQVLRDQGPAGFYKGITASYAGISETVIHIAIYERMKRSLYEMYGTCECDPRPVTSGYGLLDNIGIPATAAFTSKSCASVLTYPTEVARTRLRQSGTKYRGFFQTIQLIFREEGLRALFRGVGIQIIQKVPSTMVTMAVYEVVSSYLLDDSS